MNIVFMGTPDFAARCLEALLDSEHTVNAVFTQPDKPVGRKRIMTPPAVKVLAQRHNIPVYQPTTLRDGVGYEILKEYNPDICVVVAYGKLLPSDILNMPKYGCINIHGSLLPKYRGAAPIQWAVANGEKVTGVTSMLLDEGMDTGAILLKKEREILSDDNAETMYEKLSVDGGKLLLDTLDALEKGTVTPTKQNDDYATNAPIISKNDGIIDWNKSAYSINCFIRGMYIWPVAHSVIDGKSLKIFKAEVIENINSTPGVIIQGQKDLIVGCGENSALKIIELQQEGSKRMNAADFMRGRGFIENKFEF
ncbi:MAG: methionyl-tRNA formyltransferase [Acutalibacteraceae bacterium]|nr:methionyl-tRNA formyltransferase [Acutalibacteraceae bacterium]